MHFQTEENTSERKDLTENLCFQAEIDFPQSWSRYLGTVKRFSTDLIRHK